MTRSVAASVLPLALFACASSNAPQAGTETLPSGEAAPPGSEAPGPGQSSIACGPSICGPGQVCCNDSCGICTPPDGLCTQQVCEAAAETPVAEPPAEQVDAPTCANVRCAAGTHCELIQVQCVRAPCPPVPECRPDSEPASGVGVSCGENTCRSDEVCCNASCGICTAPGQGCIKKLCP